MKLPYNYIVFCASISILIATSCTKTTHDGNPHPYGTVLPDTGRFAVPYTYNSVNGYTTYYYPYTNIISSQGNYQNGSPSGYWKQYYSNGNMMKEGNYSNGQLTGNWIFYYRSGTKKEEGNYQNNVQSGTWKYYHPNGVLSSQGNYSNGAKQGEWKYYNTDGSLSSTITY